MPFQTFTARLVRSVALSELTKHLEFEMKSVPRFGFVAGQWLSFKTNKPDGEEIVRAYSIASPPDSDNKFALCLNRVQDGFMSNFLCDMKEGDEIALSGTIRRFHSAPSHARYDFHRHRHRDCSFSFHAALAFEFQSRVDARRARTPVLH